MKNTTLECIKGAVVGLTLLLMVIFFLSTIGRVAEEQRLEQNTLIEQCIEKTNDPEYCLEALN